MAEMKKLREDHNSAVTRLGEAHIVEIDKLKEDHGAEVSKLRDDHAAEILGLKEKHDSDLVDERTHDYNEAMAEEAKDIHVVKDRIYRGGYKFGLESAGLPDGHAFWQNGDVPTWGFLGLFLI